MQQYQAPNQSLYQNQLPIQSNVIFQMYPKTCMACNDPSAVAVPIVGAETIPHTSWASHRNNNYNCIVLCNKHKKDFVELKTLLFDSSHFDQSSYASDTIQSIPLYEMTTSVTHGAQYLRHVSIYSKSHVFMALKQHSVMKCMERGRMLADCMQSIVGIHNNSYVDSSGDVVMMRGL
jgi:hypothetical protein